MAAQFAFIVHAAEGHAFEFASEGSCDGLAERSFANAGRSDKAEDRGLGFGVHLEHAELFEDALFDLFQAIMIVIENSAGVRDVELVRGGGVPRKFQHVFKVSADDVEFRLTGAQAFEARELAFGFFLDVFRKLGFFEFFAQLSDFILVVVLVAEFRLDGAHLLAQHVVTLFLANFGAGIGGDFSSNFEYLDFMREVFVHEAKGVDCGLRCEQFLLLSNVKTEHRRKQVGEANGVSVGAFEHGADFCWRLCRLGKRDRLHGEFEEHALQGFDFGTAIFR